MRAGRPGPMNIRRLPHYLKACLRAAVTNRPRAYLKLLARSPYTVKDLAHYDISMIVDVGDPAISKPILALGEYEAALTRHLLSRVTPQTRFVDVGANIGFFTLAVARRAPRGRVWSIEPDPVNARLLRANVALNGMQDRVQVHEAAASDTEADVFFSTLGYRANLGARFTARDPATLAARSLPGAPEPVPVRALTVDGLLRGQRADLIKVDVEGFEPAVFAGMRRVLREDRPVVFSEFAPGTIRHISRTDPAELLDSLRRERYVFSVVVPDGALTFMGADVEGVLARYAEKAQHHLELMLTPEEKAATDARPPRRTGPAP